MGRVNYLVLRAHVFDLEDVIKGINERQDKIVAVTQNGNTYTIFYERNGNDKDGDTNG